MPWSTDRLLEKTESSFVISGPLAKTKQKEKTAKKHPRFQEAVFQRNPSDSFIKLSDRFTSAHIIQHPNSMRKGCFVMQARSCRLFLLASKAPNRIKSTNFLKNKFYLFFVFLELTQSVPHFHHNKCQTKPLICQRMRRDYFFPC